MELLVLAKTGNGRIPGTIIDVRPDGFAWGRQEGPPIFRRFRVADASGLGPGQLRASKVDLLSLRLIPGDLPLEELG